jgi:hypothetical protein
MSGVADVHLDRMSTSELVAVHIRSRIFDGELRSGGPMR